MNRRHQQVLAMNLQIEEHFSQNSFTLWIFFFKLQIQFFPLKIFVPREYFFPSNFFDFVLFSTCSEGKTLCVFSVWSDLTSPSFVRRARKCKTTTMHYKRILRTKKIITFLGVLLPQLSLTRLGVTYHYHRPSPSRGRKPFFKPSKYS